MKKDLQATMQAVTVRTPGDASQLIIDSYPMPQPKAYEILIRVAATALNRADLLQRQGKYPPPAGASEILGLEVAGEIVALGESSAKWRVGDKVFGLLPSGGYAQYAVMHEDMAMPIPGNLSIEEAAAIPEVFLTAFQALHWLGKLQANETALIHAGASGVGTAAIQLAREAGATVLVTASAAKHQICRELGAALTIDYRTESFEQKVLEATSGRGADVLIDFIGADYFQANLNCLATDGRLVQLATLSGSKTESFDLRQLMSKRLQLMGSTLRSRSQDYQIRLTKELAAFALPRFADGRLRPIVDRAFDWQQVREAHQYMESNQNAGKIVLRVS